MIERKPSCVKRPLAGKSYTAAAVSLLFGTPWPVACQAPLSMGFPRQEYWSGVPFPSPGDLPDPEIKPASPALAGGYFTADPHTKPQRNAIGICKYDRDR